MMHYVTYEQNETADDDECQRSKESKKQKQRDNASADLLADDEDKKRRRRQRRGSGVNDEDEDEVSSDGVFDEIGQIVMSRQEHRRNSTTGDETAASVIRETAALAELYRYQNAVNAQVWSTRVTDGDKALLRLWHLSGAVWHIDNVLTGWSTVLGNEFSG